MMKTCRFSHKKITEIPNFSLKILRTYGIKIHFGLLDKSYFSLNVCKYYCKACNVESTNVSYIRIKTLVCLLKLIDIFPDKPKLDETAAVISRADQLYNQNEILQLYDYLFDFKDLENDEILWRLARAAVDKGKHSSDDKEKRKLYFEAFDYIKKALAINEKNFAVHKVS